MLQREYESQKEVALVRAAALFMKSAKCEIKYLMLQYAERNNARSYTESPDDCSKLRQLLRLKKSYVYSIRTCFSLNIVLFYTKQNFSL